MSLSPTPVINPLFKFQFEKAQDAYVLLYPEGMITLNGSAGEIMQLVDGQHSDADIIAALSAKFPDAPDIDDDIKAFLQHAVDKQWIRYE